MQASSVYATTGAADRVQYGFGDSALGSVLVARSGEGVCAVLFGDDADALAADLATRFPHAHLRRDDDAMRADTRAVADFIQTPAQDPQLPLDIRGTAFQRRVWSALRTIPRGATASYADIAARIGAPASVRAVAGACAANPLALLVPCHRVVRGDGGLSGYCWGIERKRALLQREAAAT
jgi:AraC family transcriptional regulator of adaptative response/methylated-DNA-[protein]-cysteine methyltransferase